jgi:hypothetical protein
MRIHFVDIAFPVRIGLYLGLTTVVTLVLGSMMLRSDCANRVASFGLLGLLVCPVIQIAVFPDETDDSLIMPALLLSSPILGAIVGIGVGGLVRRLRPFTSLIRVNPEKAPTEGETAEEAVLEEAGVSPVEKTSP